jgi:hypothetical protein
MDRKWLSEVISVKYNAYEKNYLPKVLYSNNNFTNRNAALQATKHKTRISVLLGTTFCIFYIFIHNFVV